MKDSSGTTNWVRFLAMCDPQAREPWQRGAQFSVFLKAEKEAKQPKTLLSICFYKKPDSWIAAIRVLPIRPLPALGCYLAISNIIF